jgi:hypothetical protein
MVRWAHPPDDVRVDHPPFDRRHVLLAWHSKCDYAIAQWWIGNRELHVGRIASPRPGVVVMTVCVAKATGIINPDG